MKTAEEIIHDSIKQEMIAAVWIDVNDRLPKKEPYHKTSHLVVVSDGENFQTSFYLDFRTAKNKDRFYGWEVDYDRDRMSERHFNRMYIVKEVKYWFDINECIKPNHIF